MNDQNMPEFSNAEGLDLALSYLEDPSDIPCPRCGPGTMEVVAYLDAGGIEQGVVRATKPEGDYSVVLYCHECGRAAALDLSPEPELDGSNGPGGPGDEDRRAA